jgi:hypothetical protein
VIGPRRLLKPISSAQAAVGTVNIIRSAIETLFIRSPTNNAGFVGENCVEYSARTRVPLIQPVLHPGRLRTAFLSMVQASPQGIFLRPGRSAGGPAGFGLNANQCRAAKEVCSFVKRPGQPASLVMAMTENAVTSVAEGTLEASFRGKFSAMGTGYWQLCAIMNLLGCLQGRGRASCWRVDAEDDPCTRRGLRGFCCWD